MLNLLKKIKQFQEIKTIFSILETNNHKTTTMLVGGCVRNILKKEKVGDIDLATIHKPDEVKKKLTRKRIKVIDTGIAHGTVTAVIKNFKFEITTLREDSSEDGRHAKVRYIDDWERDAQRRDFTINAIYMDVNGKVFDPLNGISDLENGLVKFIGDPEKRIVEDYLRILRYFRFFLQYSVGAHDSETISAIKKNINGISKISKERISIELLKILNSKHFYILFNNNQISSIFVNLFPQLKYFLRFQKIISLSENLKQGLNIVSILSVLVIDNSDNCDYFLYKYILPNKIKKNLLFLNANFKLSEDNDILTKKGLKKIIYLSNYETAKDFLFLSFFVNEKMNNFYLAELLNFLHNYKIPSFPIDANFLMEHYGFQQNEKLGQTLNKIKKQWILNNFQLSKKDLNKIIKNK